MATPSMAQPRSKFWHTRRGRTFLENLTAYSFLLPAGIIIFVFGIFPVAFSLFVSLHRWRRFPDEYVGLDNYTRALGDIGYIFFFWLGLAALIMAGLQLWRFWQAQRIKPRNLLYLVAGAVNGLAVLLFVRWFFVLAPVVLDIPQRVRGQERVPGLFTGELAASFGYPQVVEAGSALLLAVIAGLLLSLFVTRLARSDDAGVLLLRASTIFFLIGIGYLTLELTVNVVQAAVVAAQAAGEPLPVWPQVIFISLGAAMLVAAYGLWRRAQKIDGNRNYVAAVLAVIALMVGGYFLVAELPPALERADQNLLQTFSVTIMFVLGTVPLQLGIGLVLAYLLFQDIKGKAFFRIVYFLPYITPFVATSIVFKLLFAHRPTSLANSILSGLGVDPQIWLLEPRGVFQLMFGPQVPDFLAGPSLALIVIILYSVWTYIGYNTVIFLAGLTNISPELYEAAKIDGASGWKLFRYLTIPLLSPTTFFLSLISIIGTFQAFTQIWIMRSPGSSRAVDTVSIYIFETVRDTSPNMGYGSAMAFVLFVIILVLTFVQNRYAERKVFYG